MTDQTQPTFQDITDLIEKLPDYPVFKTDETEPMAWIREWLRHNNRTLDLSHGFDVNRCALYWASYDAVDGFDGKAFVDACQSPTSSLQKLARILDTDLQIFELNPNDHSKPDANAIALAASYGMMGVEENTQLFCACSFGQGVQVTSDNALSMVSSFGLTKGSHSSSKDPAIKSQDDTFDLQDFMTTYCGLDHAAMLGAAIAATLKGIPVILEGPSGQLVEAILKRETGREFSNILVIDKIQGMIDNHLPGHAMITTAIFLKTFYAASLETKQTQTEQTAAQA